MYIYVYMYICLYISLSLSLSLPLYVSSISNYVRAYLSVRVYHVCVYARMRVCMHARMHARARVCVYPSISQSTHGHGLLLMAQQTQT